MTRRGEPVPGLKLEFSGTASEVVNHVRSRHDSSEPYGEFGVQMPDVFKEDVPADKVAQVLNSYLRDTGGIASLGYNYMAVQPARWRSWGSHDAPEPIHLYVCTKEVLDLIVSFRSTLKEIQDIRMSYPKTTEKILGSDGTMLSIERKTKECRERAREIGTALLTMDTLFLEILLDPEVSVNKAFSNRVRSDSGSKNSAEKVGR